MFQAKKYRKQELDWPEETSRSPALLIFIQFHSRLLELFERGEGGRRAVRSEKEGDKDRLQYSQASQLSVPGPGVSHHS
jgi:hypothetical protein